MTKPLRSRELETRTVSLIKEMRFRDSLRSIYKEARHLATSDGLTGLYSRGFLLEHLRDMIKDSRAQGDVFSLAFLEIANIAAINSAYGFVVGDRIIRQVGEMMGYLVRGEDLTARYSGGQFCIILARHQDRGRRGRPEPDRGRCQMHRPDRAGHRPGRSMPI